MPVLAKIEASQVSSRDRGVEQAPSFIDPDNKDFNSFISVCGDRPSLFVSTSDGASCDEGIEGYVIASNDDGPSVVSRLYVGAGTFTGLTIADLQTGFADEVIRVYVDDLSAPAYEGSLLDLQSGTSAPFTAPFASSAGAAVVSYVPISYRSKLRIVLDNLRTDSTLYYYQIEQRSAGDTVAFDTDTVARALTKEANRLESSARGDQDTSAWNDATKTIAPGEKVTVLDHRGAGTVKRLRFTLDVSALDDVTLQMIWDGQSKPAIDARLGSLFACDPTPGAFDTLPMSVALDGSGAMLTLTLPMPFAARAVVALTNDGIASHDVRTRVDGVDGVPTADWGYLRTVSNQRSSPDQGERYEAAAIDGRGKYVGTVMQMLGQANPTTSLPDPFNFLEGDDHSVADGRVVTQGSGVEEYFDGGWYFIRGTFSAPFSAAVSVGARAPDVPGQVTAVRWSILGDAIDFQKSFGLSFEYGANSPTTALDYASTAFYYAK
ncbi:MAG TPA: DUF2961 domain-containing protein [Polyangiaceae bacterium]|nr:DUF2961 domain-containing protein [Polyangiaceae bacterium]